MIYIIDHRHKPMVSSHCAIDPNNIREEIANITLVRLQDLKIKEQQTAMNSDYRCQNVIIRLVVNMVKIINWEYRSSLI